MSRECYPNEPEINLKVLMLGWATQDYFKAAYKDTQGGFETGIKIQTGDKWDG
jgi:hypothetical protein